MSLISIIVTAFFTFNFADSILKENILNQLEEQTNQRGELVRYLFDNKIQQVVSLAQAAPIQKSLLEINEITDEEDLKSKLSEYKIILTIESRNFQITDGLTFGLKDLLIWDKTGRLFFSLNESQEHAKIADELNFSNNPTSAVKLIQDSSNGMRQMAIYTPVYSSDIVSPQIIGHIVAFTSTEELDQILSNRNELETTGEIYLVNNERFMVTESIFVNNAPFNQRVETIPVSECFDNNQSYSGTYNDYRGNSILGISFCDTANDLVMLTEMDEKEVLHPLFELQEKIIFIGILLMIIVSSTTFFLSKRISEPIKKLGAAANEIAKGNFNVKTNIKTRDEIGYLSSSFDAMSKKLQESLIAINLREEIIKQQEDILLQFSEKNEKCCVCIIDIIQSTMLTDKLSDEETRDFYGIFINSVAEIVKKFNGIVVKNIGDSLLFYFKKIDDNQQDYLKNVIECCLAISDSNPEINKKMNKEGLPGIACRTSITYGPVSIAKVATSSVDDIFGATVNRCSKINRFAIPNGVVIGSDIYEPIKNFKEYKFQNMNTSKQTEAVYSVFLITRK
ncbi:adenylate/guanylate cyclase domain-containing protein [Nitrosopumilus sp. b1]|uniref:HAMP domain-containing protein n=1 Tax=Nitrosopumilus sp. b1 TaxID=2109907 RepID=UPI0015F44DED|nr:adenylate/guanylate cyclase domain-containing protein [Nitrosopumilus sp. b1]